MTTNSPLAAGQLVGSYRVLRLIGSGGMGAVYECVHGTIDSRAVLKVLRLEVRGNPAIAGRFFNEARAANRVPHPGSVRVYECGQLPDGTLWLLMEYVDGETLHARLQAARQTPPYALGLDALPILHQLAGILVTAHKHGIVHRDLKPSNIMLVADSSARGGDRVRLLDFGIAKLLDDAQQQLQSPEGHGAAAGPRTETGAILGTPAYMAPEQGMGGNPISDRADVYALGVIAYQALSGRLPFDDDPPIALLLRKMTEPAPPLRRHVPDIPTETEQLVMSMLATQSTARPSMADVERTLAELLGLSVPRRIRFNSPAIAVREVATLDGEGTGVTADAEPPPAEGSSGRPALAPPSQRPPSLVAPPSAPTLRRGSRLRNVAVLAGGGLLIGILTLGLSLYVTKQRLPKATAGAPLPPEPAPEPSPPPNELANPAPGLPDAADLASPADLSSPAEPRPVTASPAQRPEPPRPRSSAAQPACAVPRAGCVSGASSPEMASQVVSAFADVDLRLCSGEGLTIDLRGTEVFLGVPPRRLPKEDLRLLRGALRVRLAPLKAQAALDIRCKK